MKLSIYGHQPIIAPRDPVFPMEVATKSYVDSGLSNHATDQALHMTPEQNAWFDAITVTAEEVNSLSGAGGSSLQTQIDGKVSKAGDSMVGALTLSGTPTAPLHAAPKGYVDTQADLKANKAGDTFTGFVVLHADPTSNLHAATKQYVDSSLVTHANDDALHLTPAQNAFLDEVTVSSEEVNRLGGVTSNVQTQIDGKFDKTGGSISGDVTLGANKAVFVSKLPTTDNELVNKAYVDSKVQGQEWKDPVSDIDLVSLIINTVTGGEQENGIYIVGAAPTGDLVGKEGYPIFISGDSVNELKSEPVAVGDRFGVAFSVDKTPTGVDLTGLKGSIIVITDATPGAIAFTEETLTSGATTLVFDVDSVNFGNTYSLSDEGTWILTNTSVNLAAGTAIDLVGKTINVKTGPGITTSDDMISVQTSGNDALQIEEGGTLFLNLANQTLTQDGEIAGLRISTSVLDDIEDRLSKTDGGVVTGEVSFDTNASLVIGYTPLAANQAVPKHYVDTADQAIQSQVTTIAGDVSTLKADPVTKSYVDNQDATKVKKAGDTLTGFLTLHSSPTAALHAATKQYVDSTITTHINDDAKHLTVAQNTFLDELTVTSEEVNSLAGVTESIQDQLDDKVSKAGSVMTGPLVLSGNPVNVTEAAHKGYVDTQDALKANKAGDTFTGFVVLHADPTSNLHAATKRYVDTAITTSSSDATTQINGKVAKAGDTMTGFLTLHADPTSNLHSATKQYVDSGIVSTVSYIDSSIQTVQDQVTTIAGDVALLKADPVTKQYIDDGLVTKVNKAGDTLTGYMTLHADPQQPMHPASKQYVDAVAQGLAAKPSVRLATDANLNANYNNGTQGVNSTLTGVNNGALVVDGVTPAVNDRILVKKQTAKLQNGDYVVQQVGSASTPFILKRVTTLDESHEVPGSYFYVFDGATLKGTGWVFVVDSPVTFTIGTDDINVYQFSGQGNLTAGEGLSMDGNTISIGTANSNRIVVTQDAIDLAVTGVTPGTYTKVVVDGYGRVSAASNPTTIAGYGISDAQPLNTNLSNLAAVTTNGVLVRDTGNNIVTRAISATGVGITIGNGNGGSGADIVVNSNATAVAGVDTIVARDASGNFAANVITASLTGNASTATTLQSSREFSAAGDVTAEVVSFNGAGNVVLNTVLSNTGVTAGSYTKVTVDAKGRITLGSNPTTVEGMGLVDAATIEFVNNKYAELEEKFDQLFLYVMGRI